MRRRLSRNVVWILPAVCLLALVAIILAKKNARTRAGLPEFESEVALARRAGIPLTPAELDTPPKPPDQDAAGLYASTGYTLDTELSAVDRKYDGSLGVSLSVAWAAVNLYPQLSPANPSTSKGRELIRPFVSAAKPAVLAMRGVAAKPYFSGLRNAATTRDYGAQILVAKLIPKLAAADAEDQADANHALEGLRELAALAPMCGQLSQVPTLIALNAEVDAESSFEEAVSYILTVHGREPGIPEAAAVVLAALGPPPDPVRAIEDENIRISAILTDLAANTLKAQDEPPDAYQTPVAKALATSGMANRWRALQLRATREFVGAIMSTGDDWRAAEQKLEGAQTDCCDPEDDLHAEIRAAGFGPSWPTLVDPLALRLSQRRVLAQAVAVFESWNRSGKLPETLPLTGKAALDPLAAGVLHYAPTPSSFTIYGVGPYGYDHKGRKKNPTSASIDFDIVFNYPSTKSGD